MNKFKIPPFSNNNVVMLLSEYFEVNRLEIDVGWCLLENKSKNRIESNRKVLIVIFGAVE